MSSSGSDSSDEIGNVTKKKQCREDQKQNEDADVKEEYQDLDEDEEEDEGDDLESNSKKNKNEGHDGSQNQGEKSGGHSNGKKQIEIKSTYTFHNSNPNHIITNEPNDVEWECFDCNKKYKSYPAFYTHNKIKHNGNPPDRYKIPRPLDSISKDRGRPKADTSTKQKFTDKDQRQHNLEDQIYEFLAKSGANDDQDNKIIRQYLNDPVNYIEAMPVFGVQDPNIQENILQIQKEISKLVELVKQYDDYQYIDPMELSDPADHEINLFNLKYLMQHYKQNNLMNEYTLMAIFIAWIGKELRQDSYQEICNELKKHARLQPEVRRDLLEKIHKGMEYTYHLSGFQFKLFNQQLMYDFVGQVKLWMTFWIEIVYSDAIKASTFNHKQEAPIVLGSDDDEDMSEENEDDDEEEDENDENKKNKGSSKKKQNSTKQSDQKAINQNCENGKSENCQNGVSSLENPEQQQKQDSPNQGQTEKNSENGLQNNVAIDNVQVEDDS